MPSNKPQIRISELHREALDKLGASLGRTTSKQLELILNEYFVWANKPVPTLPPALPPAPAPPTLSKKEPVAPPSSTVYTWDTVLNPITKQQLIVQHNGGYYNTLINQPISQAEVDRIVRHANGEIE